MRDPRSPARSATIRDVAKLAGVSPATASLALNESPRVGAASRDRVQAAARTLRYAPNPHGRRLARRRAETLGIVSGLNLTSLFGDFFYRVVLGGVAATTHANGYGILVTPAPARPGAVAEAPGVTPGGVDGVLVIGVPDRAWIAGWRRRGLPFVLVDAYLGDAPAVVPDYRAGARLGTNHLLRLGHREVGLIAADVDYAFGADTFAGYADALARWGVRFDAARVRRCAIDADAARAAAGALLSRRRRPTAVFAVTDMMAMGVLQAARERGLRVPEDVAVVGMDDVEWSAHAIPRLTSVRIPKERIGGLAAERLLALVNGRRIRPTVTFVPGDLVVRESCGGRRLTRAPA